MRRRRVGDGTWLGVGVLDEGADLGGVVGKHAPTTPRLRAADAVDARAGPAVVALEMGDARLRARAPLHQLGERSSPLDLLTRGAGLAPSRMATRFTPRATRSASTLASP